VPMLTSGKLTRHVGTNKVLDCQISDDLSSWIVTVLRSTFDALKNIER
jgi:hypothetical protein